MKKRIQRIAFLMTTRERSLLQKLSSLRGESISVVLRDLVRKAASVNKTRIHANSEEPNDNNLE